MPSGPSLSKAQETTERPLKADGTKRSKTRLESTPFVHYHPFIQTTARRILIIPKISIACGLFGMIDQYFGALAFEPCRFLLEREPKREV